MQTLPGVERRTRRVRPSSCDTMRVMFSARFGRPVVLTRHTRLRMVERQIDEALLLRVLDEGGTRYSDATQLRDVCGLGQFIQGAADQLLQHIHKVQALFWGDVAISQRLVYGGDDHVAGPCVGDAGVVLKPILKEADLLVRQMAIRQNSLSDAQQGSARSGKVVPEGGRLTGK